MMPSTGQLAPPATQAYWWLKWVTPNQLTLGRVVAIPVLVLLIHWDLPWSNYVALAIFLLACLTDYWDGDLARVRHEVTSFGKLMDPLADKMLISASLVMLVERGSADAVPTILIVLREFAVSGLRQVAALEGVVIAAVPGAKVKTVLQMLAVGALLLSHDPLAIPLDVLGGIVLWVAVVAALWTGYGYFAEYYRNRGAAKPRP